MICSVIFHVRNELRLIIFRLWMLLLILHRWSRLLMLHLLLLHHHMLLLLNMLHWRWWCTILFILSIGWIAWLSLIRTEPVRLLFDSMLCKMLMILFILCVIKLGLSKWRCWNLWRLRVITAPGRFQPLLSEPIGVRLLNAYLLLACHRIVAGTLVRMLHVFIKHHLWYSTTRQVLSLYMLEQDSC